MTPPVQKPAHPGGLPLIPPWFIQKDRQEGDGQEEQRNQKRLQLRMAYGNLFSSEHGKTVLADLKWRYGFNGEIERPSYLPGMNHPDMCFIEGQKEVVRHVISMQSALFQSARDQPKPKEAKS